jgi:cytidylate kinase
MTERFVVISGLPGSGKTTLGRRLAAALDVGLIDKDVILAVSSVTSVKSVDSSMSPPLSQIQPRQRFHRDGADYQLAQDVKRRIRRAHHARRSASLSYPRGSLR